MPAATPTTSPPSGAASGTSSGAVGRTQTFTLQRGAIPAGLTGDTAAAAEAWLVSWEYLAVAESIPFVDPATSGTVMTGAAATKADAYAAKLQRAKTHVVGTVQVDRTRVVVNGSKATLCCRLRMNAFEFDARGKPVESTLRSVLFFKGTAVRRWSCPGPPRLRRALATGTGGPPGVDTRLPRSASAVTQPLTAGAESPSGFRPPAGGPDQALAP